MLHNPLNLTQCSRCGKTLTGGEALCSTCKAASALLYKPVEDASVSICPNCNSVQPKGTIFCACGHMLMNAHDIETMEAEGRLTDLEEHDIFKIMGADTAKKSFFSFFKSEEGWTAEGIAKIGLVAVVAIIIAVVLIDRIS